MGDFKLPQFSLDEAASRPDVPPPTAADLSIPVEAYAASTSYAMDPTLELGSNDWDEVDRANATRVDELNNEFIDRQHEILHTGDDAFFKQTGRDAILNAPAIHARLEAARQETLGRAANDVQREWLGETLRKHRIVEHFDIGDHVGRQSLVWQKAVNRRRLDNLNHQAGLEYRIPGAVEALANASESSARDHARASGHRPDSPEAQAEVDIARSTVFRHAIEGALAKGANSVAIKLHERAKDKLAPSDAEFLNKVIDLAREAEVGRAYVAKIAPLSLTINTSIGDLDKAQDDATAKNNEDCRDNETQRVTNQHFIDIQFGKAKRQVDEDKAKLARTVHDWLTVPGPNGLPRIERPPIAIWARLTPEERKRVDAVLEQAIDTTIDSVASKPEIVLTPYMISRETPAKGDDNLLPAQARPSGTVRGGRLVRPWEEMRIEIFESHIRAIRELDPSNRYLSYVLPINGVPHPRAVRALRDELIRLREKTKDTEITPDVAPKSGRSIDPFRLPINDPNIQPRISRIDEKGRPTFEWTPQGQYSVDLRRWQERPAAGNEAFHYTRNDVARLIREGGLNDGSYATTTRSLSPLQAQIDLALPPWRDLPGTVLRIDLEAMRARGYVIPKPTPVTRSFAMPGGGYEIHFPYPIPPEYITVIK